MFETVSDEPEGPKFKTVIVTRGLQHAIVSGGGAGQARTEPAGTGWGRGNGYLASKTGLAGGRSSGGVAAAVAMALLAAAERAGSEPRVIHISSTKNASIKIAKGKPRTIKTNVPFYEIVIGDPEVANVNPLTDYSFYVLGNNLVTTGIALFDENKQLVGTVDIEVTLDTDSSPAPSATMFRAPTSRSIRPTAAWSCRVRPRTRSPPTRPPRSPPTSPARRR